MAKNPAANFAAAAQAPAPVNRQVVEAVIKELKSSLGTAFTGSAPYKSVDSVELVSSSYHEKKGAAYGKIVITSENGSMHGDKWETKKRFYVSRADASALAEFAPERFRSAFAEIISVLDAEAAKHEVKREEAKMEEQQKLFTKFAHHFTHGSGTPIAAPERASFRKTAAKKSSLSGGA